MSVTWGLLWGGSRSTKPGVFPCEVAAAGDERFVVQSSTGKYLVQAL